MKPAFTILLLFAIGAAVAQDAPPANPRPRPQGEGMRGMQMQVRGTGGTITAIEGDTIKLKGLDGKDAVVKISDKTVYRKDQKEAKLADFKTGDIVIVRGEQNPDGSWAAQNVISRPELAQMLAQAQGAAAGNGAGRTTMMMSGPGMSSGNFQEMFEQGWAKTFVVGQVKSIEGTKIAIEGPMNKTATIEVDENTSFRQGGSGPAENITLADIKPGANVVGCGAVNKDGVFVPTVLTVSGQGAGMLGALAGCQNLRPQK